MSGLKEIAKEKLAKVGAVPDTCGVVDCANTDAEVVEILPLDPIDHDKTIIQLCPAHTVWANERNELAKSVKQALVKERKRIGQNRIDEIRELTVPQGAMDEDVLMGDVPDGEFLSLDGVLER